MSDVDEDDASADKQSSYEEEQSGSEEGEVYR